MTGRSYEMTERSCGVAEKSNSMAEARYQAGAQDEMIRRGGD